VAKGVTTGQVVVDFSICAVKWIDAFVPGHGIVLGPGLVMRLFRFMRMLTAGSLTSQLRRLTHLVISILTSRLDLSPHDVHLLTPDLERFQLLLPTLAPYLSRHLQASHATLNSISNLPPTQTKHSQAQSSLSLPDQVSIRVAHLSEQQSLLNTNLSSLTTTSSTVLTTQTTLINQVILALELIKHGSLSRFSKARADHLSTVAAGMSKKIAIMNQEAELGIYTAEVREALGNYETHLENEMRGLEQRGVELRERLEELEAIKGLEGIAVRVGKLKGEIESVRGDIGRLEGKQG
jgi:hypothetical protein